MANKVHASKFSNLMLLQMNDARTRDRWSTVEEIVKPVAEKENYAVNESLMTIAKRIMKRLKISGLVERSGGKLYKISTKAKSEGWDRNDPMGLESVTPIPPDDDDADEPKPADESALEEPADPVATPAPVNPIEAKEIIELRSRVKVLENVNKLIRNELDEKENRLDQVEKLAASAAAVKTIKIEKYDGKIITLKNVMLPSYFQTMLDLAKKRRNILLVGPAGCGKTTVAGLLSKTLGMKFGKIGGCGGLTESHLLGRYNPLEKGSAKYVASEFVIRFEQGGVMLIDELDGADQNVLLALNPALDRSGELPLMNRPGKPVAIRHKDFVCIATANTFGTGSNRMYAGRNQLDASTLSRFQIGLIECDYDKNVETAIAASFGGEMELLNRIWEIRRKASEAILRRVVDTRFVEDAYVMKTAASWSDDKIIGQLLQGWTRDERSKVGEYSTAV